MHTQRNVGRRHHKRLLNLLISKSERAILCSGWINHAGLAHLLPAIDAALGRGADILVYSNGRHTDAEVLKALASRPGLKHVVADAGVKYLHTKLDYFARGDGYTAVLGSAHLAEGGLIRNEELSIVLTGTKGDAGFQELAHYLSTLPSALGLA